MTDGRHAIAYGREVYAACLTVGFTDEHLAPLKRLLDLERLAPGQADEIVALARAAQSASVTWASGRDRYRGSTR